MEKFLRAYFDGTFVLQFVTNLFVDPEGVGVSINPVTSRLVENDEDGPQVIADLYDMIASELGSGCFIVRVSLQFPGGGVREHYFSIKSGKPVEDSAMKAGCHYTNFYIYDTIDKRSIRIGKSDSVRNL